MHKNFSLAAKIDEADSRPLPLIVAEHWGFSLAYIDQDGEVPHYLYGVRDWLTGLVNLKYARSYIEAARKPGGAFRKGRVSIRVLQEKQQSGQVADVEYVTAEFLYRIAQDARLTTQRKETSALPHIKDFLAKAGVFADLARRDPEAAELALHQRRGRKYLKQGKAPEWIASRELGIVTRKQLMSLVYHLLHTDEHMAAITVDTYRGVFGMTAQEIRNHLGIPQGGVVRDHFSTMALVYTQAAEEACRIQLQRYGDDDIVEVEDVRAVITTLTRHIGKQVKDMAKLLGIDILSGQPVLGTGSSNEQMVEEGKRLLSKSKLNPFSGGD